MDEAVRVPQGETAQEALGEHLGARLRPGTVVHLLGEIGAGKTTLTRGLLRGLGVTTPARSPTYTLVEPHSGARGPVYHFDLYRLADPEELQFFGAEEYFSPESICILEWAERASDTLPSPDLVIRTDYRGSESRGVAIRALSEAGRSALLGLG